jgi:hypothetical protein
VIDDGILGPIRLGPERILIPKRATYRPGSKFEAIGVGRVEIGPDDPHYAEWDQYLRLQETDTIRAPVQSWARRVAGQM